MPKYFLSVLILIFFFSVSSSNIVSLSSDETFIYPTSYTSISSEYGYRTLYGASNFHNGIDFLAPEGSEIYASRSGYVEYASFMESGYGNTIIISHDDVYKTLYCHVSSNFIVNVGEYVSQGQVIGYVGPKYLEDGTLNGNTTGPHLHFTIFENGNTINPIEKLP